MPLVLASCGGCDPSVGPMPTDIVPLVSVAICCGLLLLGESGVLLWQLRRVGAPKMWRQRVLLPAALGAFALGGAAFALGGAAQEWRAMRALRATQPDAWHLAFQRRVPGDWFDQMSAALVSAQMGTRLIMLVTFVALGVGALRLAAGARYEIHLERDFALHGLPE